MTDFAATILSRCFIKIARAFVVVFTYGFPEEYRKRALGELE